VQPEIAIGNGFGGARQAWQVRCGHARDLGAGFLNRESSNFAIAPRANQQTLTRVDSREGRMIVRGCSALELAFLSLTAAGVIGIVAAGLQVVFRIAD